MKKIIFAAFIFINSNLLTANAQPGHLISIKANAITYLYGTKASKSEGMVAKQNGDFMKFTGPSKMEWAIHVTDPGDYEVNFTHSVKSFAEGKHVSITSGNSVVSYTLVATQGVWGNRLLRKNIT